MLAGLVIFASPRGIKIFAAWDQLSRRREQNYFQGFEIYFQGTKIYFQGLEINFKATKKVFIRRARDL